jgi:transposase
MSNQNQKPMSPEDFVRVWQRSNSITEVADHFEREYSTIYQKAKAYRKAGIPLKEMPRSRRKLDINALKQLAEQSGS